MTTTTTTRQVGLLELERMTAGSLVCCLGCRGDIEQGCAAEYGRLVDSGDVLGLLHPHCADELAGLRGAFRP